jgi:hypothetical protein
MLSLSPKRKVLLSIFLSIYVSCIWLMACPPQWTITRRVVAPMRWVLQYIGIWFDPGLFAPAPPLELHRFDCRVIFNDGSIVHWKYPRDGTFVWDKKMYERLFLVYILNGETTKRIYPSFARYLVREHQTASRSPMIVEIIRYDSPIAPPESILAAPTPEREHLLYRYIVMPEDLL